MGLGDILGALGSAGNSPLGLLGSLGGGQGMGTGGGLGGIFGGQMFGGGFGQQQQDDGQTDYSRMMMQLFPGIIGGGNPNLNYLNRIGGG